MVVYHHFYVWVLCNLRNHRFHAVGKTNEILHVLHSQTHAYPLSFHLFLGKFDIRSRICMGSRGVRVVLQLVDRIIRASASLFRFLQVGKTHAYAAQFHLAYLLLRRSCFCSCFWRSSSRSDSRSFSLWG